MILIDYIIVLIEFSDAALNLFINTNAQDLLKEMKPDLKRKLVQIMSNFMSRLMDKIPYDHWIE